MIFFPVDNVLDKTPPIFTSTYPFSDSKCSIDTLFWGEDQRDNFFRTYHPTRLKSRSNCFLKTWFAIRHAGRQGVWMKNENTPANKLQTVGNVKFEINNYKKLVEIKFKNSLITRIIVIFFLLITHAPFHNVTTRYIILASDSLFSIHTDGTRIFAKHEKTQRRSYRCYFIGCSIHVCGQYRPVRGDQIRSNGWDTIIITRVH